MLAHRVLSAGTCHDHPGFAPVQPSSFKIESRCSKTVSDRSREEMICVNLNRESHELGPLWWAIRWRAALQPVQNRFRSDPTKDNATSYDWDRIDRRVPRFFQGAGLGLANGTTQTRLTSGTISSSSAPTAVVMTSTSAPPMAKARMAGMECTVSPRNPRSTTRIFFQAGRGMG